MEIYNYHPITGEYIGTGTADPSPLEPGEYLIPASATTEVPPVAGQDQAVVYENGWQLKPDHRGKSFFKKETKEHIAITEIGIEPDDTMTELVPAENQKWGGEGWVLDAVNALAEIRFMRDLLLVDADELVQRHNEQLTLFQHNLGTPVLTEDQYLELLMYKQNLRDLPEQANPDLEHPVYPIKPSFMV